MYNRIILMGRLTRDPELKTTASGISMCRFSIAVERRYAKQGEERQTDFFDITCFRQQAEFICKYFTKGRPILVEGTLQNNNYTDQNGVKHYGIAIMADSVSFCGDKRSEQSGSDSVQHAQRPAPQPQTAANHAAKPIELGDLGDFEEILSDGEVPF